MTTKFLEMQQRKVKLTTCNYHTNGFINKPKVTGF